MRNSPPESDAYRLVFTLPVRLRLSVPLGRHHPCLHRCLVMIDERFTVTVEAPSREIATDQAARFLTPHSRGLVAKGADPILINAVLFTPAREGRRGGADSYAIAIGANIAIGPAAIDPVLYPASFATDRVA